MIMTRPEQTSYIFVIRMGIYFAGFSAYQNHKIIRRPDQTKYHLVIRIGV
jgi:hypothetical protein